MTRWLLLCVTLISLPAVTDWLVDRQFRRHHTDRNIGYSQEDRDGLSRLIESSPGKAVYVWRTRKAAQIAEVWNLTPGHARQRGGHPGESEMSDTPQNPAAFPLPETPDTHANYGMTLLDWFAGMAVQAIVSKPDCRNFESASIARHAYQIAHSMLAERAGRMP